MNIYFSNFTNVDLKNSTSQGADYSNQEQQRNMFLRQYDLLTRSSPEQDTEVFNDLIMQSFQTFSPFSRSKTDNTQMLGRHIINFQLNSHPTIQEDQLDHSIKSNINSILDSSSNQEKVRFSPKVKQAVKAKNSILAFQYSGKITIRHVYNLFSNFGNIAFITRKRDYFYIRFRSMQFSAIASTYLQGYKFYGTKLQLFSPSNQQNALPKQNQFSQCIYYDASYDRFTPQKSITINAPGPTLHISSLKRQICRENSLRQIFEEFGDIQGIKILKQSNDKNMALVQFYQIEDSFAAISELHNQVFSGRKMQISFTKSRIY